MRLGQQFVGGVIGGVMGAGAWIAIVHFTGYEVGFVAWGVGVLVGLGAMMLSEGKSSATGGILAGLIAIAAVLGGKAGSAYLMTDEIQAQLALDGAMAKEMAISALAEEVLEEFTQSGVDMDDEWPRGVLDEDDPRAFYPPQVWAEAENRWYGMPTDERLAMRGQIERDVSASSGVLFLLLFFSSFGLFDVIWLVLASMSAFKIASSGGDESTMGQVARAGGPPMNRTMPGVPGTAPAGGGTGDNGGPNFLPMRKPDAEPHNAPLSRRTASLEQIEVQHGEGAGMPSPQAGTGEAHPDTPTPPNLEDESDNQRFAA